MSSYYWWCKKFVWRYGHKNGFLLERIVDKCIVWDKYLCASWEKKKKSYSKILFGWLVTEFCLSCLDIFFYEAERLLGWLKIACCIKGCHKGKEAWWPRIMASTKQCIDFEDSWRFFLFSVRKTNVLLSKSIESRNLFFFCICIIYFCSSQSIMQYSQITNICFNKVFCCVSLVLPVSSSSVLFSS